MLNNSNNLITNIKNLSTMVIILHYEKHQMLIQIQILEILKEKECLLIIHLISTLNMTVKFQDFHKLH